MPISYKIDRKRFEVFGDQIGALLCREFKSQFEQHDIGEAEVEIYRERIKPIDINSEPRVINIQYASTPFDSKHQGNSSGNHTYFIDFYGGTGAKGEDEADEVSSLMIQRMMGIAWEILEHPDHATLELAKPSVSGLHVTNLEILNAKDGDNWLATTYGRLTLEVRTTEFTRLPDGTALQTSITQVKLGLTEKGYRFEYTAP